MPLTGSVALKYFLNVCVASFKKSIEKIKIKTLAKPKLTAANAQRIIGKKELLNNTILQIISRFQNVQFLKYIFSFFWLKLYTNFLMLLLEFPSNHSVFLRHSNTYFHWLLVFTGSFM
uniref:Uncharacterized protein n=1 Tax=Octopus bimaculoides TaxID=37653 RepID=A0A0L8GP04_OCTBM